MNDLNCYLVVIFGEGEGEGKSKGPVPPLEFLLLAKLPLVE